MTRIKRLAVENFKRVRVIEIKPGPHATTIGGRNEQGKSSILDAIQAVVGGKRHSPGKPIRLGEDKGRIELETDDFSIVRRFTDGGKTQLEVMTPEGATYKKPQAMLDALLGPFLDPSRFVKMTPKQQRDELLACCDLGDFDLENSEARERKLADDRLILGRHVKSLRAQHTENLEELGGKKAIEALPDSPEDADQVAGELKTAEELHGLAVTRVTDLARMNRENIEKTEEAEKGIGTLEETVDTARSAFESFGDIREREMCELNLKLDEREAGLKASHEKGIDLVVDAKDGHEAARKAREAEIHGLKDLHERTKLPDREEILERLKGLQASNAKIADAAKLKALEARLTEAEGKSDEIDSDIHDIRETRSHALMAGKLPVEGLGFADGIVTVGEIPFDQCSSAQKLQVALNIAMATTGKLRFIRMQDGAFLDDEHLELVRKMAEEHDFQVFIERVGDADLIIEDGVVVDQEEESGDAD